MTDQSGVVVAQHVKLEKRNEAGELYETVEIDVDAQGVRARVTQRKEGLAPASAYSNLASMESS